MGTVGAGALVALDEPVVADGEVPEPGVASGVEVSDVGFVDFGPLVAVSPTFGASVVESSVVDEENRELVVVWTGAAGTYRTGA